MQVTEITACRSCGSERLETVLDLKTLAISDFILPNETEEHAPLELVCCLDCSLVQLRHTVDRDHLYKGTYWYRSGINESMVAALKNVVDDAMSRVHLQEGDAVLDIGCNDGSMLAFYPDFVKREGFEPNIHLAVEALRRAGDKVMMDYFPSKEWKAPRQKYKIITAIAQLYNVNDLNGYVAEIERLLHPDGVWIVQMQDLEGMLATTGFDNVCAEHLTCIGLPAFINLIGRHGLVIRGWSRNNVNGDSVRYVVGHADSNWGQFVYGMARPDRDYRAELHAFGEKVQSLKTETMTLLHRLKAEGKTVCGIAASTKFNTLAQYYGITPDLLPAIAERSPEKVGRMTVGTHIPIISEKELYKRKPDYLLACAWQFFDSFRERYKDLGAKWIVPLPTLRIVEATHVTDLQPTRA